MKEKPFKWYEIILPVLIGWLVIGWFFINEFEINYFSTSNFSFIIVLFTILAFLFMLVRDIGMIWRFRLLTDRNLS